VGVNAAGHFFGRVGLWVAKKRMHPKGLALTPTMCGGLWGTAYFCIDFFLFIKYLYLLITEQVPIIRRFGTLELLMF
jgi:hypothetical protein